MCSIFTYVVPLHVMCCVVVHIFPLPHINMQLCGEVGELKSGAKLNDASTQRQGNRQTIVPHKKEEKNTEATGDTILISGVA